jgi:hypothetical protein
MSCAKRWYFSAVPTYTVMMLSCLQCIYLIPTNGPCSELGNEEDERCTVYYKLLNCYMNFREARAVAKIIEEEYRTDRDHIRT